jgi:hypothetical protein
MSGAAAHSTTNLPSNRLLSSWTVAAAAGIATVLGPVLYLTMLELGRGSSVLDALGFGLVAVVPAFFFVPHYLVAVWLFSFLAASVLLRINLARPSVMSVLGAGIGLAFFFLGLDNPLIGDEQQRFKIATYFAVAGAIDGFLFCSILQLSVRRAAAPQKS